MDAEFHVDAALGEVVEEFADFVLRLRDSHAIARDNDNFVGSDKNAGSLFGAGASDCALFGNFSGGDLHLTESAEEDVRKGPVHGLAHDHREDETRGTIESAGDDED